MEVRQLEYFVAVCRTRHFRRAAESLYIAQPSLSQQIRLLEGELGVRLFDRNRRHVRLTQEGEALLVRAERVLRELDNARLELAEFSGLPRGEVAVGALGTNEHEEVPALLVGFQRLYSHVIVSLREASSATLLDGLRNGELDVAFTAFDTSHGAALPKDLTVESLYTDDLVALVAEDHLLAGRGTVSLEQLRNYRLILGRQGSIIRDTFLRGCALEGVSPQLGFVGTSVTWLRVIAASGMGVGVLPRRVAQTLPDLVRLDIASPLTFSVGLAWPTDRYRPAAVNLFLDYAREQLPALTSAAAAAPAACSCPPNLL